MSFYMAKECKDCKEQFYNYEFLLTEGEELTCPNCKSKNLKDVTLSSSDVMKTNAKNKI